MCVRVSSSRSTMFIAIQHDYERDAHIRKRGSKLSARLQPCQ